MAPSSFFQSILDTVDACMNHWMFASLLASAEGGGISTHQLEEAKNGLKILLDGLRERRTFEESAEERREEEERKKRMEEEESQRRRRRRDEERARRPGSRGTLLSREGGKLSSGNFSSITSMERRSKKG